MMHNLNHKYTKEKEEDRIDIIIIIMTSRQEIDHLVEIEGHPIEVEEDLAGIYRKNYRERLQDNFRNDYRRDNYRYQRYSNSSGSRDNYRDTYRDSSRDEYSIDGNFGRDRNRMRQTHSLSRREDRRSSSRVTSRSASRSGSRSSSRLSTTRIESGAINIEGTITLPSNCPNSVTNEGSDQDDSSHPALQN